MLFEILKRLYFREEVDGVKFSIGGVLPHIEDIRDFLFQDLGGIFDYKPKHVRLILPTKTIKTQYPNNTCCFQSYATCREVSEGTPLSPRSLVAYAKSNGYLRSNGYSSLREAHKAGIEFGIAEEKLVPNIQAGWSTYSNVPITSDIRVNAANHKGKSYFIVKGKNDWLKALDEGYAIQTGIDWYTSYNQKGGFKAPWIVQWRKGTKITSHAIACIGYDMSKGLLIFQNSFGETWGDKGLFYANMSDFFRENIIGMVAVDLDEDKTTLLLKTYEGKDVKASSNPGIYRIQGGKKRPYPNEMVFHAFGGKFETERGGPTYSLIATSLMEKFPAGEPMSLNELKV